MKNLTNIRTFTVFIILMGIVLTTACDMSVKRNNEETQGYDFYIGTGTDGPDGGIYKALLDTSGHFTKVKKVAAVDHPTFLTFSADKQFLLNVNEHQKNDGMGGVESWKIIDDSLKFVSRSISGGAHPCFITANESGDVLVANYTGGNVGLLKVSKNGKLTELLDVAQHIGDSVSPRQDRPHAHSAWFEPDGSGIIAVDLGTNELWFYTLDQENNKLLPKPPYKIAMAPGAGPRHLAFHPNQKWVYVINELNSTITKIAKNADGSYDVEELVSTLPDDFTDHNQCAHVAVSSDGKFLYASNRGHNSIAIFEIDQQTGKLKSSSYEPVHGNWPRHFALSPDGNFLVVANRWSGNLVSFARNADTGLLRYVDQTKLTEPVCVLF